MLLCILILLFHINRLAQRIVQGDVPQALMNRKVFVLLEFCIIFSFSVFLGKGGWGQAQMFLGCGID